MPTKKRLERLKGEFITELQHGKYKYLTQEDVAEIEAKKKLHITTIFQLSPSERTNWLKEFIIRFTYDSSKLSGIRVTLRQTYLVLKEGIIPSDLKNLKTIKELENHSKGVLVITKYKGNLSMAFIKRLHRVLLSGIEDSVAGKTRDELKRNVKLAGTSYVPPTWHEIKKELQHFFKWYKSENRRLHPIELAALVHIKMISLQPFVDGNSRTSRAIFAKCLIEKGFPIIKIPIGFSEQYMNLTKLSKKRRMKTKRSF